MIWIDHTDKAKAGLAFYSPPYWGKLRQSNPDGKRVVMINPKMVRWNLLDI